MWEQPEREGKVQGKGGSGRGDSGKWRDSGVETVGMGVSTGNLEVRVALRPALQGEIPFLLPFCFSLRPGTM